MTKLGIGFIDNKKFLFSDNERIVEYSIKHNITRIAESISLTLFYNNYVQQALDFKGIISNLYLDVKVVDENVSICGYIKISPMVKIYNKEDLNVRVWNEYKSKYYSEFIEMWEKYGDNKMLGDVRNALNTIKKYPQEIISIEPDNKQEYYIY